MGRLGVKKNDFSMKNHFFSPLKPLCEAPKAPSIIFNFIRPPYLTFLKVIKRRKIVTRLYSEMGLREKN